MTNDIPPGFEPCLCCDGHGHIFLGLEDSGSRDEPPSERTVVCESCNGDGMFPEENDEDFDAEEGPDCEDGDIDFALASAGFETDEDYGSASDIDFD